MTFKVLIKNHERGLLFRKGNFVRVLPAGEYRLWSRVFQPEFGGDRRIQHAGDRMFVTRFWKHSRHGRNFRPRRRCSR